ncbi:unnamed protein product [Haemonchus placei]|uniref:Rhodanese domain-containing protein n=1 Tax=Haemonchus placei TaxID=6290 RepID=A0A0N4W9P2_HAEPC|nr:unnamed protein product [Haemonchus placei]
MLENFRPVDDKTTTRWSAVGRPTHISIEAIRCRLEGGGVETPRPKEALAGRKEFRAFFANLKEPRLSGCGRGLINYCNGQGNAVNVVVVLGWKCRHDYCYERWVDGKEHLNKDWLFVHTVDNEHTETIM